MLELAYYDVAIQHISHYIMGTPQICTVVWFQVFLCNTNNDMVSSDYFHIIIVIYSTHSHMASSK